jgi:hypothetical protein
MVGKANYSISNGDPSNHRIEHGRTRSIGILPKEGCRFHLGTENKRHLWKCGEGEVGI